MGAQRKGDGAFQYLVGLPLSAVTFIGDYYQLLFGSEVLSIYSHPVVQTSNKRSFRFSDQGYRDSLCEGIGRKVVDAGDTANELTIQFDDGVRISVSLRAEDRIGGGPESIVAQGGMLVVGDSIADS